MRLAIGMVNQKTTAVRLIPVIGKGVGETVEFGGLAWLCADHAGKQLLLRSFCGKRRTYPCTDPQLQKLERV